MKTVVWTEWKNSEFFKELGFVLYNANYLWIQSNEVLVFKLSNSLKSFANTRLLSTSFISTLLGVRYNWADNLRDFLIQWKRYSIIEEKDPIFKTFMALSFGDRCLIEKERGELFTHFKLGIEIKDKDRIQFKVV